MNRVIIIMIMLIGFAENLFPGALDKYSQACLKLDAQGCLSLGLAYAKGIETERDYELAKDFLGSACDLGNTQACTELKDIDQHRNDSGIGTSDTELDNDIVVLRNDCDRGDGGECWHLGYLYGEGKEVKRNYAKAGKYYKKACDLGNGLGCLNIGYLYDEGKGVKRSYSKAAEYYKKSCNLADGTGCDLLAGAYKEGKGVERNYAKMVKYCKKSCDLDNNRGCLLLALAYAYGKGVERNDAKAEEYSKKSCDLGSKEGCGFYREIFK